MGTEDGFARSAVNLLDHLRQGDYAGVREGFTEKMAHALSEDELAETWRHVTEHLGDYLSTADAKTSARDTLTIVHVPMRFAHGELDNQVTFDPAGHVAGLFFHLHSPHAVSAAIPPRDYVLKCSDGHFYRASYETLLFRSIHFGATQFRPCPVDGKWRRAELVNPAYLTDEQLADAAAHCA